MSERRHWSYCLTDGGWGSIGLLLEASHPDDDPELTRHRKRYLRQFREGRETVDLIVWVWAMSEAITRRNEVPPEHLLAAAAFDQRMQAEIEERKERGEPWGATR